MLKVFLNLIFCIFTLFRIVKLQDISSFNFSSMTDNLNLDSFKQLFDNVDLGSLDGKNLKDTVENTQALIKLMNTFNSISENKKKALLEDQETLLNLLKSKFNDDSNNKSMIDSMYLIVNELKKEFTIKKFAEYVDKLKTFIDSNQNIYSADVQSQINSLQTLMSTINLFSSLDFLKKDKSVSSIPETKNNFNINDLSQLIDSLQNVGDNNILKQSLNELIKNNSNDFFSKSSELDNLIKQIGNLGKNNDSSKNNNVEEKPQTNNYAKPSSSNDNQIVIILCVGLFVIVISFTIAIFYLKKRSISSSQIEYSAHSYTDSASTISIETSSSNKSNKLFK